MNEKQEEKKEKEEKKRQRYFGRWNYSLHGRADIIITGREHEKEEE